MKNAITPDDLSRLLEIDSFKPRVCHVMPSVASENKGLKEALQWLHDNMEPL
jgi:hypothetical protein